MVLAVLLDFLRLKGLTNKREIKVSTQSGRMTLHVMDNEDVCVNMGEPEFEPQKVPFRAQSRKPILSER